jgi:hypothetical protein
MTMLNVIPPEDKRIIIRVRAERCMVARFRETEPFIYAVEFAANWEDLEPDARQAAQAQVGALVVNEDLDCPSDLAARAVWPEGEEDAPDA